MFRVLVRYLDKHRFQISADMLQEFEVAKRTKIFKLLKLFRKFRNTVLWLEVYDVGQFGDSIVNKSYTLSCTRN